MPDVAAGQPVIDFEEEPSDRWYIPVQKSELTSVNFRPYFFYSAASVVISRIRLVAFYDAESPYPC